MNYLDIYPELQNVKWCDLIRISKWKVAREILLPLPFLIISLVLLAKTYFFAALFSLFFFFLTGLRLSHNAQHNIVGCNRKGCDWILFILSPLMMNSMHAVQVTHLRHHNLCLTPEDEEGHCAKMPFYQALFYGPLFTINMHLNALKYGNPKQVRWIKLELFTELSFLVLSLLSGILTLQIFVISMLIANCLTAFFCVWLVHYGCDGIDKVSRTIRSPLINKISFNMFLHVEHHLFPQIPTCNLDTLSERIDEVSDRFKKNSVF